MEIDPQIKVLNVLVAYKDNKTYIYTTHTKKDNIAYFTKKTWDNKVKPIIGCEYDRQLSFCIEYDNHDDCKHVQRVWNEIAHPWIEKGFATFNGKFYGKPLHDLFDRIYETFNVPDRVNKRISYQKKLDSIIPYHKTCGYVYLMKITNGTVTRYKIGKTDRLPLLRLREIQEIYAEHEYTVTLEDYNTTSDSIGDEGRLHMLCSKYKSDPIIKKEDDTKSAYDGYNSELFKFEPEVKEIWDKYWR